ncbi:corticoliberin [Erythrolamprus reginae]|uniref:corticoliberin n=1 Tax=Erythrolamprus reginae TaxID=121349 RepID=UPI00396C482F
MKIQLLALSTGILLLALQPCHECRTLSKGAPATPAASSALQQLDLQESPQSLPILLRMGEEYFLRLGSLRKNPAAPAAAGSFSSTTSTSSSHLAASGPSAGNFFRAVVQQLQQLQRFQERSLEGAPDSWDGEDDGARPPPAPEKEKRSEEPPISLDLTFHLLREVLEMARAEQLAQQAHSNRKLMEIIGK